MPLDETDTWTWGYLLDFGVPSTVSQCTMASSIELDTTANGGQDIGGLALVNDKVNVSGIDIQYGTNTFKIKGAATSNDGGASANCESSSITITYSCEKADIRSVVTYNYGTPYSFDYPIYQFQVGYQSQVWTGIPDRVKSQSKGCSESWAMIEASSDQIVFDTSTNELSRVDYTATGQYSFKIQLTVKDQAAVFTSDTFYIVAGCTSHNSLTQSITQVQTFYINDANTDFVFAEFKNALYESYCPYLGIEIRNENQTGLLSTITTDSGQMSISYLDKTKEQSVYFQIYAWTESNNAYAWDQYNIYQLFCGPNSIQTVTDTSKSSVQLFVNGTVDNFDFAEKEFVLSPVTDCNIQSYTITSSTGGLNSLVGPDSSGIYNVTVTNMLIEGTYNFKVIANVQGGDTYESSKTITVVCGPESKINADPDLVHNYTMYLGEVEITSWQMTQPVAVPACPIQSSSICSNEACTAVNDQFENSGTIESPIIKMTEDYWNKTLSYSFYVQYITNGNGVFVTNMKTIDIVCHPTDVTITQDHSKRVLELFNEEIDDDGINVFQWPNFKSFYNAECPVEYYQVTQIDAEGNVGFPVELDSELGVQESTEQGYHEVTIKNEYMKVIGKSFQFNLTAHIKGGSTYQSLTKTIKIIQAPNTNAAPRFKESLESQSIEKGQSFHFVSPVATDPEKDDFVISMAENEDIEKVVFVQNGNNTFSLSFETEQLATSEYKFEIKLNDSKSLEVTKYELSVNVYKKFVPKFNFNYQDESLEQAEDVSGLTKVEEYIPNRPQFKMGKIDVIGQVKIIFNQDMVVPKAMNYSEVFEIFIENYSSGEREYAEYLKPQNSSRMLLGSSVLLGISWFVASHTPREIYLQLNFESPELVSTSIGKHDTLGIQVRDIGVFESAEGVKMRFQDQTTMNTDRFEIAIPKQTSDVNSIYTMSNTAESLQKQVDFLQKSNIIVVLLAQGSFQQFWSLIRASQMLIFTSYVSYNYPPLLQTFMAYTFYISEMDVFNTAVIFNKVEYKSGTKEYNQNFALFNVGNTVFLTNAGPVIAIGLAAVFHKMVTYVIFLLAKRFYRFKICRQIGMMVTDINLTHELVKLSNEAYLDFFMAGMMTFVIMMQESEGLSHYFQSLGDTLSNALCFIVMIYLCGLPIFEFSMIHYGLKQGLVDKGQFKKRFSVFYEDYRLTKMSAISFGLVLKIRRLIFVFVLLSFHTQPHLQTGLLAQVSLWNFIYIHNFRPYPDSYQNRIELFNEAAVYFVTMFNMCFFAAYPNGQFEARFKDIAQNIVLAITGGNLSINLILMIVFMIRDVFYRALEIYQNAKDYVLFKKNFRVKDGLLKKYPDQLEFIKWRDQQKYAIRQCKIWKEERDWCVDQGLDVSSLADEKQYQNFKETYKFQTQKSIVDNQIKIFRLITQDKKSESKIEKKRNIITKNISSSANQVLKLRKICKTKSYLDPKKSLNVIDEVLNDDTSYGNIKFEDDALTNRQCSDIASPDFRELKLNSRQGTAVPGTLVSEYDQSPTVQIIQTESDSLSEDKSPVSDLKKGGGQPKLGQEIQINESSPNTEEDMKDPPQIKTFHLNSKINNDILKCLKEMRDLDQVPTLVTQVETLKKLKLQLEKSLFYEIPTQGGQNLKVKSKDHAESKAFICTIDLEIDKLVEEIQELKKQQHNFMKNLYSENKMGDVGVYEAFLSQLDFIVQEEADQDIQKQSQEDQEKLWEMVSIILIEQNEEQLRDNYQLAKQTLQDFVQKQKSSNDLKMRVLKKRIENFKRKKQIKNLVGEVELTSSSSSSESSSSEDAEPETNEEYMEKYKELIGSKTNVFAAISCSIELDIFQQSPSEVDENNNKIPSMMQKIIQSQDYDTDLIQWPLDIIKKLMQKKELSAVDIQTPLYYIINQQHLAEQNIDSLSFKSEPQVLQSFKVMPCEIEVQLNMEDILQNIIHNFIGSSPVCLFMQMIYKQKRTFYKCLCYQHEFIHASMIKIIEDGTIKESDSIETLIQNQFQRNEIDEVCYCSKCKVNRQGQFRETKALFMPEVFMVGFEKGWKGDVKETINLREIQDKENFLYLNNVLNILEPVKNIEKQLEDEAQKLIEEAEKVVGTHKQQDHQSSDSLSISDSNSPRSKESQSVGSSQQQEEEKNEEDKEYESQIEEIISKFGEATTNQLRTEMQEKKNQKREEAQIIDNLSADGTYELFAQVTKKKKNVFQSYVFNNEYWYQISGMKQKRLGEDLPILESEEAVVVQFYRCVRYSK